MVESCVCVCVCIVWYRRTVLALPESRSIEANGKLHPFHISMYFFTFSGLHLMIFKVSLIEVYGYVHRSIYVRSYHIPYISRVMYSNVRPICGHVLNLCAIHELEFEFDCEHNVLCTLNVSSKI